MLYPLTISLSLCLEQRLHISYSYIIKILSFMSLTMTMGFIHLLLKKMNARPIIQALAILCAGFSPIMINYSLCLYSENACWPWLMAAVYGGSAYIDSFQITRQRNLQPAVFLGIALLGFTLVKGVGEAIFPLFLSSLIWIAWQHSASHFIPFLKKSKTTILIAILIFFIPITFIKILNYKYNGQFTYTNRGNLSLYGQIISRSRIPINKDNILSHFLTVPVSYERCINFFPSDTCEQWSMAHSDATFLNRYNSLIAQGVPADQSNKIIRDEMLSAIVQSPLAQIIYWAQETMKMFFWETTQGPFVAYPPWLEKLFNQGWLIMIMSWGVGITCCGAFIIAFRHTQEKIILVTVILTSLLMALFGFVHILHRYTIIIAPLMILLIFASLEKCLPRHKPASDPSAINKKD
ncbi:MAG: hypothetical protein WCI27_00605 [Candidatus Omnitrophota bacterium]